MSDLADRPLTRITPAMLARVAELPRGVIVARLSRCGRYYTFRAVSLDDAGTEADAATGRVTIIADAEDVDNFTRAHGRDACSRLQLAALNLLPNTPATV